MEQKNKLLKILGLYSILPIVSLILLIINEYFENSGRSGVTDLEGGLGGLFLYVYALTVIVIFVGIIHLGLMLNRRVNVGKFSAVIVALLLFGLMYFIQIDILINTIVSTLVFLILFIIHKR